MGKTITLYLTDDELKLINHICETQGCNTHSVVKAGVQLFLCEATKRNLFPEQKMAESQPPPKKAKRKPDLLERLFMEDKEVGENEEND